jgi:Cu/Ag efflux pump CusA
MSQSRTLSRLLRPRVVRRLRENATRPEAERLPVVEVVYRASIETRHSVVFATVIVALVLLP